MSELQVIVSQQAGVINFNYEELKDNLSAMMSAYEGATFHEDTATQAKKEVATLKKIKKALSDRRIEVKKECMKPYDDFENKVKELTSLIDKPIELIDSQVKVFEEKKKAEKKIEIQKIYDTAIGELTEFVPLNKIYDSKWENVSVSIKSIKTEIEEVITSVGMAIATIKGMNSEAEQKALDQYKVNLSLADAITCINKYEQQKAEILKREEEKRKAEEERKRLEEIEKIKADERKRIAEEERIETEKIAEEERIREEERIATEKRLLSIQKPIEKVSEPFPDIESVTEDLEEPFTSEEEKPFEIEEEKPFDAEHEEIFVIKGTENELQQVAMYLNSIGLEFERRA